MTPDQYIKLQSALTWYDRRVNKRNPYALGHYLAALDRADKQAGDLRSALTANFNDRLLDVCLKAVALAPATLAEVRGQWRLPNG